MNLLLKIKFILLNNGVKRAEFLKKKNILQSIGNNCLFQPYKLPMDPKLIKLHDNVYVAANVSFITHNTARNMLSNKYNKYYSMDLGCIEVYDNVFIGANSIILPNIEISENVIVAAGSVVTKSIPSNVIVAGNPAKIIGTFDDFNLKNENITKLVGNKSYKEYVDFCWENFKTNKKDFLKK